MLVGILLLSGVWYLLGASRREIEANELTVHAGGRKHYRGPRNFSGGSSHAVLTSAGERPLSDLPTVASHAGSDDYPAEKASI